MQLLENSYIRERNVKDLKKVKIKASIRIIQRAWRRYYQTSKLRKIVTIQLWYKNIIEKRIQAEKLGEQLKNHYFARIIQHRLKDLYKLKRSRKMTDCVKSRITSNNYDSSVRHIIKLQGFVRMIISKQKLRKMKYIRDQLFIKLFKSFREICTATRSIDSELTRRIGYCKAEISSIDKYLSQEHSSFNQNWEDYEKKLEHYLLHEKEFEDWHQTKDPIGTTYWINNKLLKKSTHHPGIKSFKANKKKLRLEAEEEQQIQIGVVEHVRKRFVLMMNALLVHRSKDLKEIRGGVMGRKIN